MSLRTDYKDDLFSGNRKYNIVDDEGNIIYANVHFSDETEYDQEGDAFGAGIVNAQNDAINKAVSHTEGQAVGATDTPVYVASDGTATKCSATVGTATKPIYMNGGKLTAMSQTIGSATKPVYMSGGALTASGSTVGAANRPIYMNSGTLTPISGAVGSSTKPIFVNSNGVLTASGATVGSDSKPVYIKDGVLTAVSTAFNVHNISAHTKTLTNDGKLRLSPKVFTTIDLTATIPVSASQKFRITGVRKVWFTSNDFYFLGGFDIDDVDLADDYVGIKFSVRVYNNAETTQIINEGIIKLEFEYVIIS